jgi:hypothetical protein
VIGESVRARQISEDYLDEAGSILYLLPQLVQIIQRFCGIPRGPLPTDDSSRVNLAAAMKSPN